MSSRRVLGILAQVVALGAGGWFLLRTAAASWGTIALSDLRPAWLPIVVASVLTAATYLFLVFLWVVSLRWWQERFPYLEAARVWFVSNLARFIPGMVWHLLGVAAMAQARDLSPLAAAGGILLQQFVLVLTALVVAAAWAPALLSGWARAIPAESLLALTGLGVALLVLVLPRAMPLMGRAVARVLRRPVSWPALPPGEFTLYVLGLCVPWVAYGIAFWLFGRGLLGTQAPSFPLAVGGYVASYVVGLIVVFAPSGLVVREAAMVAALAPAIGGGAALVLAIATRVWLLMVELATALGVVLLHGVVHGRRPQGTSGAGRQ
ncbi:MAG: hypothetical protein HYT81_03625 [Gemmatimonadetes bacterium]|nr:hypothetical protein [Gemmatimonadota bacterium]